MKKILFAALLALVFVSCEEKKEVGKERGMDISGNYHVVLKGYVDMIPNYNVEFDVSLVYDEECNCFKSVIDGEIDEGGCLKTDENGRVSGNMRVKTRFENVVLERHELTGHRGESREIGGYFEGRTYFLAEYPGSHRILEKNVRGYFRLTPLQ